MRKYDIQNRRTKVSVSCANTGSSMAFNDIGSLHFRLLRQLGKLRIEIRTHFIRALGLLLLHGARKSALTKSMQHRNDGQGAIVHLLLATVISHHWYKAPLV